MNLNNVRSSLEKFYGGLGINVKYEQNEDKVKAVSENISIKGYDDDVYISVAIYRVGIMSFDFIFDKLDINTRTLSLINDFNGGVFAFKAFIDSKNFLHIIHEAEPVDESTVYSYISNVFDDMISDHTRKYLGPLTELSR